MIHCGSDLLWWGFMDGIKSTWVEELSVEIKSSWVEELSVEIKSTWVPSFTQVGVEHCNSQSASRGYWYIYHILLFHCTPRE